MDPARLVINLHLSDRYNDTGTSLWHLKPAKHEPVGACIGTDPEMRDICFGGAGDQTRKYKQLIAQGRELSFGPGDVDPTGTFVMSGIVPVKANRMVVYSGHCWHSQYILPDAGERLQQDEPSAPTQRRLMMQDFVVSLPLHAWQVLVS